MTDLGGREPKSEDTTAKKGGGDTFTGKGSGKPGDGKLDKDSKEGLGGSGKKKLRMRTFRDS